jgi:hypothetical protein
MYNSKTALIVDAVFAGFFTVLAFAVGITHFGEPYNELYFAVSFICCVLTKFLAEKVENFKKDK